MKEAEKLLEEVGANPDALLEVIHSFTNIYIYVDDISLL